MLAFSIDYYGVLFRATQSVGLFCTYITFHSSKGLEFEQVIVFAEDYRLSDMSSIYNHYVAVTRAKSKLIIVKLNNYNANCFHNNLKKIFSKSGHNIEDIVLF